MKANKTPQRLNESTIATLELVMADLKEHANYYKYICEDHGTNAANMDRYARFLGINEHFLEIKHSNYLYFKNKDNKERMAKANKENAKPVAKKEGSKLLRMSWT